MFAPSHAKQHAGHKISLPSGSIQSPGRGRQTESSYNAALESPRCMHGSILRDLHAQHLLFLLPVLVSESIQPYAILLPPAAMHVPAPSSVFQLFCPPGSPSLGLSLS